MKYLNRKHLHEKPTAHISYHVGLNLVRQFLVFAAHHTVEDIQAFTAQWVPSPHWIRTEDVPIPTNHITTAATYLHKQLGPAGIQAVGGKTWWQWREGGSPLRAEWIDMRDQFNRRKQRGEECTRCMLYIHGGAYYFGSVDEHRYQMQRHARKLQARVFAPRYRLAPQFPFPCGLQDCLAAYLYLLTIQPPDTILLGGDSAGGGMVVALLVLLRDQGIPLPAGAILLSPWVDLTHSFPSVAGGNEFDYIPSNGFVHRPSRNWPPPNSDDLKVFDELRDKGYNTAQAAAAVFEKKAHEDPAKATGYNLVKPDANHHQAPMPGRGENLSLEIDGKIVEIKDQIQMYATNALLSHPLVSPVMTPSLGGLPPLLIQVGGGEMLRDEQIYLAHKAADPTAYPPSEEQLAVQGARAADVKRWPPTEVQLQVWDDLCHVAPTLSFTRPAKWMYRAVAQFGVWALARAQSIDVKTAHLQVQELEEEASVISSDSDSMTSLDSNTSDEEGQGRRSTKSRLRSHSRRKSSVVAAQAQANLNDAAGASIGFVGQPGESLPTFPHHILRQRVTRHGEIFPLAPASQLPGCSLPASQIGRIKAGPVRKWLATQVEWDKKYAKEKRAVQEKRMKEWTQLAANDDTDDRVPAGERPPPTALVGRKRETRKKGEQKRARSVGTMGLKMWSGWGSKHDDDVIEKRERALSKAAADHEHDQNNDEGDEDAENVAGAGRSRSRKASKATRSRSRSHVPPSSRQAGMEIRDAADYGAAQGAVLHKEVLLDYSVIPPRPFGAAGTVNTATAAADPPQIVLNDGRGGVEEEMLQGERPSAVRFFTAKEQL